MKNKCVNSNTGGEMYNYKTNKKIIQAWGIKYLPGFIVFTIVFVNHINAQNLVIENTTINASENYTENSITLGPNVTIGNSGDVVLKSMEQIIKSSAMNHFVSFGRQSSHSHHQE